MTTRQKTLIEIELENLRRLGYSWSNYEFEILPTSLLIVAEDGIKSSVYYDYYAANVVLPPIAVIPMRNSHKYEIVDGNKRFSSALAAGVEYLPVLVMKNFSFWTPTYS